MCHKCVTNTLQMRHLFGVQKIDPDPNPDPMGPGPIGCRTGRVPKRYEVDDCTCLHQWIQCIQFNNLGAHFEKSKELNGFMDPVGSTKR